MKFFIALLPFIFLGSTVRAFVDANILPYTPYTVSPGIYLFTAALFFISFGISYHLSKKSKITIRVLFLLLVFVGLSFDIFGKSAIIQAKTPVNAGGTDLLITNITTNAGDFQSGEIPKYAKFEISFDIT